MGPSIKYVSLAAVGGCRDRRYKALHVMGVGVGVIWPIVT